MTAKFRPICGFIGCDPKHGECMGFCDPATFHRVDASQLERGTVVHVGGDVEQRDLPIDVAEPDGNGMQMLALALILTLLAVLLGLSLWSHA